MDPVSIGVAIVAVVASIGWYKSYRTKNQKQDGLKKLKSSLDEHKKLVEDAKQKSGNITGQIDRLKKIAEDADKDLDKLRQDYQKLIKDNEEYKKRVDAIKTAP